MIEEPGRPSGTTPGRGGRRVGRRILKWLLLATVTVVLLFAMQVSILAFPQPWFDHRERTGCCSVYSDAPIDADLREVLRDVDERLKAVELYEPGEVYRVFLCGSQRRFSTFARLALVYPMVQGFNLSLMGNTFISLDRVARLGEAAWHPPYGIRDGSLAHAIAHEIVHQSSEAALGFSTYYRLPLWKSEGYAEYGSKIHATRTDPGGTLAKRIEYLESDPIWAPGPNYYRDVYRGYLMVEYLAEIRGLNFADIMREEVTEEDTYREMIAWYESLDPAGREPAPGPGE